MMTGVRQTRPRYVRNCLATRNESERFWSFRITHSLLRCILDDVVLALPSSLATGYESVRKNENDTGQVTSRWERTKTIQVWTGIRTFLFPTVFAGCAGELLIPFVTCTSIHHSPPILVIVFEIAG